MGMASGLALHLNCQSGEQLKLQEVPHHEPLLLEKWTAVLSISDHLATLVIFITMHGYWRSYADRFWYVCIVKFLVSTQVYCSPSIFELCNCTLKYRFLCLIYMHMHDMLLLSSTPSDDNYLVGLATTFGSSCTRTPSYRRHRNLAQVRFTLQEKWPY